ncbi:MAG: carboxypeptidase regulatory-like domain-containing protein [Candidatus Bathyarchaeota archaeon]|nr:carboxypeptidase regulatory-like domain-containing protein [Candidatus Bathyarchaeota archaeon]
MKRTKVISVIALLFILWLFSSTITPTATAASQTDINNSISKGLAYLATRQSATGQIGSSYPTVCTAMAVLAFENAGYYAGDGSTYANNVKKGFEYIFTKAHTVAIGLQTAGNPDTNGNGIGIYFETSNTIYQTPMVLMAIVGSQTPDAVATTGPANVLGRTYHDIVQDIVDWLAWGQTDASAGNYRGGWRYTANYGSSDNSNTQWSMLGLMTAELWGIQAPEFVKTELAYWITATQSMTGTSVSNFFYGAFDYYQGANFHSIAETATGMLELTYIGASKTDPRMVAAQGYINRDWATSSSWRVNIGNLYAMYAVMKAARLSIPTPITFLTQYDNTLGVEWYNGTGQYADQLISHQNTAGYWDQWGSNPETLPRELSTSFATLILQFVPVVVTYDLTITITDPPPPVPVAGALVTIEGPETRSGYTDSNGKITFYNVQAGTYQVTVTAPGYISPEPQTLSLTSDVTFTFDLAPQMATGATVWTTDAMENPKSTFNLGEDVYIYWTSTPAEAHIDLKVVEESTGNVVFGPVLNQPTENSPLSFKPAAPGAYTILVNGEAAATIITGEFFVVPESIVGSLMVMLSAFAALTMMKIAKHKHN